MSEQVLVSRDALRRLLEQIEIPANGSTRVYFVATNEFRAAYLALFDALYAPAPAAAKAGRQWRHEKSGNTYYEVCRAHLCVSDAQPKEGDEVVIYRSAEGLLYAREDQDFRRRFTVQSSEATP